MPQWWQVGRLLLFECFLTVSAEVRLAFSQITLSLPFICLLCGGTYLDEEGISTLPFLGISYLIQDLRAFNRKQFSLMWPTFPQLWQVGTNLLWACVPESLDLGFTQLFKQEFSELSKQVISTITGLIKREFNSESEAC
jgi:hypothetical protein